MERKIIVVKLTIAVNSKRFLAEVSRLTLIHVSGLAPLRFSQSQRVYYIASLRQASLQQNSAAYYCKPFDTHRIADFSQFFVVKMRLLTHNMLKSHVKGVKNGYPLVIEVQILSLLRNLNYIVSEDNDILTFTWNHRKIER